MSSSRMEVLVKPSKKRFKLYLDDDGRLVVELMSPPTKGKANKELLQNLKKKLGCNVNLVRGQTSTIKLLEFTLSETELKRRINELVEAD